MLKVTVVLPVHNGEKYIKQSIDSVLNQTYKNIELIIVNDFSTDSTKKIVESYLFDKRVKLINNEKNEKLPASLNIGFKASTGELLTWTSDDNIYQENALEKMVGIIEAKKFDFVYSDYINIDENGNVIGEVILEEPEKLIFYNTIGACFLYTRKVYEIIGEYNEKRFLAEDYEYWIRTYEKFKMYHLSEILYSYRMHEQSLTSTKANKVKEVDKNLKKDYLYLVLKDKNPEHRHRRYLYYDVLYEDKSIWKTIRTKIIIKDKRYIPFRIRRFIKTIFRKKQSNE